MRYVKKTELITIAGLFTGIIMLLLGFLLDSRFFQNVGIVLLFVANIGYGMADFYGRIFFTAFQITFFTFLLGRTVSYMLVGKKEIYNFSTEILNHTNICLALALVSLLLGFIIASNFKRNHTMVDNNQINNDVYQTLKYTSVRYVSKLFYYCTFPFSILIGLEKLILVRSMGYAEYYVSYTSNFPYIIVKIADACIIAYYVFLATFPSKKEVRIPTILFLIHAVLSLGSGKRAEFIVPLILLVLYYCVRNTVNNDGKPWITGKSFRVILVVIPFLLAAMFTFNSSRFGLASSNNKENDSNIIEKVAGFFENTGFSVNVISFEKYYENDIPDKCYSFGDTIDYLRENVITQLFFDFPVYRNQTVEKALKGNNFSQTITYLRSPSYYLSGRGYGSSYIAEAYHDMGYFGVVFWSVLYSFVLANMYDFRNKGIAYVAISLSALHYILIAPRNMASAFMSEMINVNSWLVIVIILFIAKFLRNNR